MAVYKVTVNFRDAGPRTKRCKTLEKARAYVHDMRLQMGWSFFSVDDGESYALFRRDGKQLFWTEKRISPKKG